MKLNFEKNLLKETTANSSSGFTFKKNQTVISGLESRFKSVKQNNEGNKVIMFILRLLVNQCSVRVKQKSWAKRMTKRHLLYSPHSIYTLPQQQHKAGLLWLTLIYYGAVRVNARYNLYITVSVSYNAIFWRNTYNITYLHCMEIIITTHL